MLTLIKVVNVSQIETYYPVICGGDKLNLHYAKAEDLREYLNLTVIRVEVMVHFGCSLGDMVELGYSRNYKIDSVSGVLSEL